MGSHGFIGCACRSRRPANVPCPASFGLPDLAAAKPAASSTPTRARWGQELKITFQIREPGRKNKLLLVLEDIELNIFGGHGAEKGKEARHITKSSKDVGVVRCVGDIGQDWVGLGRGLCRSRREGNFICRSVCQLVWSAIGTIQTVLS